MGEISQESIYTPF